MKETITRRRETLRKTGKKGFTLVELIVVIVILAILAAIAIPAMTGYIAQAKTNSAETTASIALNAAQTLATEAYGKTGNVVTVAKLPSTGNTVTIPPSTASTTAQTNLLDAIKALTGDNNYSSVIITQTDANNTITGFSVQSSTFTGTAKWDGTKWTIEQPTT
jgi:type IV pilus assembly protein PilA